MMRLLTFTILIFLSFLNLKAIELPDTIVIKSDINAEKISTDLDSLVNTWYVRMAMQYNPVNFSNDTA
jgi:hypothetical protein